MNCLSIVRTNDSLNQVMLPQVNTPPEKGKIQMVRDFWVEVETPRGGDILGQGGDSLREKKGHLGPELKIQSLGIQTLWLGLEQLNDSRWRISVFTVPVLWTGVVDL